MAELRSRSGCQSSYQTGPVPHLLSVLAKADPVGLGWTELILGRQQVVVPLHGGGDHVEEDDRRAHGLSENILGSGSDAKRARERE